MCPDQQLLSIYLDGELPSPWKEKMKKHLDGCSICREKLDYFKQLHELFRKDTSARRTIVNRTAEEKQEEMEQIEASKDRVWQRLESKQRFKSRPGVWQRKFSIPLPAAAAAAIAIALLTLFWFRNGNNQRLENERANFILASEEEMPGMIPTADMNGVLQYLNPDGSDIIILMLPENRNFSRTGEPAVIRSADYSTRRQPIK